MGAPVFRPSAEKRPANIKLTTLHPERSRGIVFPAIFHRGRGSNIEVRFNIPDWLERALVLPILLYRRICYGYAFRKIPLTRGKYAIVDPCDYYTQARYKWHVSKGTRTHYAVRQICLGGRKTKAIHMHREILKAPDGIYIDHINRNGLDNRKANLRLATRTQNARNRPKTNKKTHSKYKGVSFRSHNRKWCATIFSNGRNFHLGHFDNQIDAARAYDAAAKKYHKEFAALNFPVSKNR